MNKIKQEIKRLEKEKELYYKKYNSIFSYTKDATLSIIIGYTMYWWQPSLETMLLFLFLLRGVEKINLNYEVEKIETQIKNKTFQILKKERIKKEERVKQLEREMYEKQLREEHKMKIVSLTSWKKQREELKKYKKQYKSKK